MKDRWESEDFRIVCGEWKGELMSKLEGTMRTREIFFSSKIWTSFSTEFKCDFCLPMWKIIIILFFIGPFPLLSHKQRNQKESLLRSGLGSHATLLAWVQERKVRCHLAIPTCMTSYCPVILPGTLAPLVSWELTSWIINSSFKGERWSKPEVLKCRIMSLAWPLPNSNTVAVTRGALKCDSIWK